VGSQPQPRRWRGTLIQDVTLNEGAYGCALGNVVVESSDQDEQARTALSGHFAIWEALLAQESRRIQDDRCSSRHGFHPGPNSLTYRTWRACWGATVIDAANEGLRQPMLRGADDGQPPRSQFSTQREGLMHYAYWSRVVSQPASNQSR
jgi:hypothetical protein